MKAPEIRILVAERNPHMREFLLRELARKNFLVHGAKNSSELLESMRGDSAPQLLVFALNTINTEGSDLLERVVGEFPNIPVVVHAYLGDIGDTPALSRVAAMVEKSGNPEKLVKVVLQVLKKRFAHLLEDSETQSETPEADNG